ncbi:hypothetical protein B0H10DRAFT_2247703 [Mycena sp. CBHHK59/15]|nr:hypothetical protein B0H10DRAFT_2247703 [Mycena sp. CBHHK59/15]
MAFALPSHIQLSRSSLILFTPALYLPEYIARLDARAPTKELTLWKQATVTKILASPEFSDLDLAKHPRAKWFEMIVRKYTNYLHQVYKKAHPETVSASDIIKANPLLKFSSVLSGRQLFARDMHDEIVAASKQHVIDKGTNEAGTYQTVLKTMSDGLDADKKIEWDARAEEECSDLDAALRTAVRFELDDLAPRQAIVLAQQETRRTEGNTPEERVVLFINMIRKTKCNAIDSMGKPCRGGPILKPKPQGPSRGHELFVGCSGWTPKFQQGHLTHTISDNVNENLLARGLAGLPLADDVSKDTSPCSGIIHPHIGLKKKLCPHAHIVNGLQVQGEIKNYPCTALRWIYVPKNSSIRQVLIIHNDLGHNHPCPALSKVTFGHKDTYRRCIQANGVLGATVAKIDNAQSTKMLLAGKTPAAHAAPLHNKRAKRSILHAEKLQKYPNGLGVDAIYSIYRAELTKPLPERYVHSYIETPKGEKIIVTFVVYLLKLLDDPRVTSFDGDTTFKGVEGKMNEWELTIFAKVVQRAASVLRAYINGSSADFFELLFDELQKRKLEVTGKPIAFKIFVPGGNLLVANVDMDTAQVIGLCRSVLSFSDPEYSRIPKDTPPKQIAPKFIKSCLRHGKEPIHDFRALVSPAQLARLQDCFYLDSVESLNTFSSFVYGLNMGGTELMRAAEGKIFLNLTLYKASMTQFPAKYKVT